MIEADMNKTFIGKVLSDGHLSLPEDSAKEVGKTYKVTLVPLDELPNASKWIGRLAEIKGLGHLTEDDVREAIKEFRGIPIMTAAEFLKRIAKPTDTPDEKS